MPTAERSHADACPGVFATHDAADGPLARVRLPGGAVTASQLRVLADCAEDLGDGFVHLTSRGNLQLRGLSKQDSELVPRLAGAGLLPAPEHERVRNFLASPASGLTGGLLDVRPLVRELDRSVCARSELASLPGRFLFALDDGRGDVSGEDPDVCWRAVDATTGALLVAGADSGLRIPRQHAVTALVSAAATFLQIRGTGDQAVWRVRELPGAVEAITTALAAVGRRVPPRPMPGGERLPIGTHRTDGGDLIACVAPVLGQLDSPALRLLAGMTAEVVVTPWRTIVVPVGSGSAVAELTEAGFVTDAADPVAGVSACAGLPGCAKSRADVRSDALRASAALSPGIRTHFSGCERRCGRPRQAHRDVLAEDGGYRVDDAWVPLDRLVDSLASSPAGKEDDA
ncbi:precorrin-3B synthase [Amycolatopsis marina]|uniref:Precorrin-3B synthase n=1 Tax=Amycolatopsis marina TaxID=490629 RepID=A0A1I0WY77_9PSEU|nr:nitrite/sulfite reductase [Amycolatopsis marina]SFA93088.1 precorrin-3B synthase [Amycolatopsis marina]